MAFSELDNASALQVKLKKQLEDTNQGNRNLEANMRAVEKELTGHFSALLEVDEAEDSP